MSDTCRACCAFDTLVPEDLDYGNLVYATQDFSFVINCPPGYYCRPGQFPVTVIIGKDTIPPVTVPPNITTTGGPIILRSCSGFITGVVTIGTTPGALGLILQSMQERWAQQQALCDVISGLTPLPAGLVETVGNDEQCYTTINGTCPPGEVQQTPVTVCIAADTFTQDLTMPTVAQYQAAKATLNAEALLKAQNQAEAMQVCGWKNAGNSYIGPCGCSPGCGIFGPFGWTWIGGELFSTVSQADANAKALCAACDKLYQLCVASGCPDCLGPRNLCAPNPCPP